MPLQLAFSGRFYPGNVRISINSMIPVHPSPPSPTSNASGYCLPCFLCTRQTEPQRALSALYTSNVTSKFYRASYAVLSRRRHMVRLSWIWRVYAKTSADKLGFCAGIHPPFSCMIYKRGLGRRVQWTCWGVLRRNTTGAGFKLTSAACRESSNAVAWWIRIISRSDLRTIIFKPESINLIWRYWRISILLQRFHIALLHHLYR